MQMSVFDTLPASSCTCQPAFKRARSVSMHAARRPPRQGSTYLSEAPAVDNTISPIDRFKQAADVTKRGGRFKSDFIWNTKWKEGLEFKESEEENRRQAQAAGPSKPVGGLGLARLSSMNDMAQDLSEQLKPRSSPTAPPQAPRPARRPAGKAGKAGTIKATQAEMRRWDRQASYLRQKAGKQSSAATASAQDAAAKKKDYDAMKVELQGLTASLVALGICACAVFYSKETAGSYAAGGLGGFLYLRMLQRSVDAYGAAPSSPAGLVGAMTSNNRMLVPFLLALAFNRWNTVVAPQVGASAQLLPMLVGFFTYKAAILGRGGLDLLDDLTGGRAASPSSAENAGNAP